MTARERELDPGPIAYRDMALFGDMDLEQGLRHAGFNPETTTYRLIEVPLSSIGDTRSMSDWKHPNVAYVDAMKNGAQFPPIVVMPTKTGWTLLDGVTRTYAAWALGVQSMTAYELLSGSRIL